MRNKKFLDEVKTASNIPKAIAPRDGVGKTVQFTFKSHDRRFLKELLIEAQTCIKTGEHPQKLAKLLHQGQNYSPSPKKDEDGSLIYSTTTADTLNLSGYPESTVTDLRCFMDEFTGFVPDILELVSDGFTDEQKYILLLQKCSLGWIALGLFHRIFGGIPDPINCEDCPLNNIFYKTQVLDAINVGFSEFQLITEGETYIREFAKKHHKEYSFAHPLDLFIQNFRQSVENSNNSILCGHTEYKDKKEIKKSHATLKKYVKGAIEIDQKEMIEKDLFSEGWPGIIVLALAPYYASREDPALIG